MNNSWKEYQTFDFSSNETYDKIKLWDDERIKFEESL